MDPRNREGDETPGGGGAGGGGTAGYRTPRREGARAAQLWAGLAEVPGVTLYGPRPRDGGERAAVVSLTLEGWEPTDAALVLDEQFDIQCRPGLHCAPWAHRSLGTL